MSQNIERFMQTKISFDLEKNGHHTPSGLGDKSTVVVRQKGR